jgi:hypothetical protein
MKGLPLPQKECAAAAGAAAGYSLSGHGRKCKKNRMGSAGFFKNAELPVSFAARLRL